MVRRRLQSILPPRTETTSGQVALARSRPLLRKEAACRAKTRRSRGAGHRGARPAEAALRLAARAMLPFYLKIAASRSFSRRWSGNVVGLRLDAMKKQLGEASPLAGRAEQGLGTNGIGYFIDYPAIGTKEAFATGVTIPPGTVQFYFSPEAHAVVAEALLPFCEALAASRGYASALVSAMDAGDKRGAEKLVRRLVRTSALRVVDAAPDYLSLDFKPAESKYVYRSLFFREGV